MDHVMSCFRLLTNVYCCCRSVDEFNQSIASHPSFGDVVKSKIISTKTDLKSLSRTYVEGHYSGEELLGAFQETFLNTQGCR